MEVTKANFEVMLPRMLSLLAKAEFYTVDFEMTGIRTPEDNCDITDPAAKCFVEKNKAAKMYNLVQFGVCFFERVTPDDAPVPRYNAYPFNMFVFPGDAAADVRINVDTAGFLSKHGMDFTKWITQGIPYLSTTAANARRASHSERTNAKSAAPWDQSMLAKIDKSDANAFTNAMADAARLLERVQESADSDGAIPEPSPVSIPSFKDKSTINIFSAYLESIGLTKVGEKSQRGMNWSMVSAESSAKRALQEMERSIGVTRLYEALVASRKPIVAHNCLMDMLFMHHHFNGLAVADLAEFKIALQTSFPCIFDTRYLATHPAVPFDPKVVQNLEGQYNAFLALHNDAVRVDLPIGFEAYDPAVLRNTSRAHEAGYDALITGKLLLFMAKQLGDGTPASLEAKKYANKIPVYGCLEVVQLGQATDSIDHDGPILAFSFPRSAGLSSTRIDQMLTGNDLRGRVLWNGDKAFVFCPASARGSLFDKSVGQAQKQLRQATSKGVVTILRP